MFIEMLYLSLALLRYVKADHMLDALHLAFHRSQAPFSFFTALSRPPLELHPHTLERVGAERVSQM